MQAPLRCCLLLCLWLAWPLPCAWCQVVPPASAQPATKPPASAQPATPPPAAPVVITPLPPVTLPVAIGTPAAPPRAVLSEPPPPSPKLPTNYVPWWDEPVRTPLRPTVPPLAMPLESVVLGVLHHSPQVRVMADTPVIRKAAIAEAQGRFNVRAFMDTKWVDTSDPVGNKLTTGGATRFIDQNWNYAGGVRQTTTTGAQLELAQKYGYQDNNSIFFLPKPQGTSRIVLNYTQPLLSGAGKCYNTSLIVLAEINTKIAQDEMCRDLQTLLLDVHKAYWDLRLQRSALLQRRRLRESAQTIQAALNARREIDVLRSQLVRAEAAVATREAAVIRFGTSVENAETRLRTLLNDPQLLCGPAAELIPTEAPQRELLPVDLNESLTTALQCRPEITQAMKEIRVASVRADVSKNEMLPIVNLVLGTYVYGLAGDADILKAWSRQFDAGRPTYSGGLTFEYPFGNQTAKSRNLQRRIELRQATNQLKVVSLQVRNEVEVAVREVNTAYREMVSKQHAVMADEAEIAYLTDRWRLLPGDQQVAGVVLDDLLNAQERLADAEFGYSQAEAVYNLSLIALRRVMGTLLDYQDLSFLDTCVNGLPTTLIDKNSPGGMSPVQPTPAAPTEVIPVPPPAPSPVGPQLPATAMRPQPPAIQYPSTRYR